MMNTKRVGRWNLLPSEVVVNESGLAWFRPYVSLLTYEELVHEAMKHRQSAALKTTMDSSPLVGLLRKGETP